MSSASRSRSPRAFVAVRTSGVSTSLQGRDAGRHRDHVVVERAGMAQRASGVGSKAAISSRRPPNAPNVIPPARYLPSVVMSGRTPKRALRAAGRQPRCHHLVEDQTAHRCVARHVAAPRGTPARPGCSRRNPAAARRARARISSPVAANRPATRVDVVVGHGTKSWGTLTSRWPWRT